MASNVDALAIRRGLQEHDPGWGAPVPFGPDGWAFVHHDRHASCIVSSAVMPDGTEWVHASITAGTTEAAYAALKTLHRAVWGTTGWAYQVFAPPQDHINLHANCLHLFGRLDGKPELPDFTWASGTI